MNYFNAENFKAAVALTLEQNQVDRLVKPQNSEFYYLKSLAFEQLALAEETVFKYETVVKYKAEAKYQSRKTAKSRNKTETYSSHAVATEIVESEGIGRVPKELYDRYRPQKSYFGPPMLAEVDETIIHQATLKIKGKVRRAGDPIEREDIHTLNILSKTAERPEEPVEYFKWTALVDKRSGEEIGYAIATLNGVQYFFHPDKTKEGLDKTMKPPKKEHEKKAEKPAAPPKAKKKREGRSFGSAVSSIFSQLVLAIVVSAAVLLVEAIGVLVAYQGVIPRNDPGLYQINNENYEDYIMLTAYSGGSTVEKQNEGERRTYVTRLSESNMSDYPLFSVIPRSSAFCIFDIGENKSVSHLEEYTASDLFKIKVPKYKITDLQVKFEVTYSLGGVEETVIAETYISEYRQSSDAIVKVDLPQESMTSHTGEYVTDMKGNTVTRTFYWADLDYWSVRVLDVSGTAEVEEVQTNE